VGGQRHNSTMIRYIVFFALASSLLAETPSFTPLPLSGQTFIHDPSTIIKDDGRFYIYGTGPGIRSQSSPDLICWTNGPAVFDAPPAWVKAIVPEFRRDFWAPDIIRVNGNFFLYYAASSMGKQTSAIGLATNATLNPAATNYLWADQGPIISSTPAAAFNTIDPSVMLDTDGKLWLAFGSYWEGIFLAELDAQTGHRIATNSPLYHLAWNHSIEAACLTRHEKYYYLFINWGSCCQGTNSTYEVRVGRAEHITGPYLDRDGKNLNDGGGSLFLHRQGRYFGPGHIGILRDGGNEWFSYHYYDADTNGRSRLSIGKLAWPDDWPVPAN
jgi:arabinan endo-1,5-alpha-L-arabinosidase